MFGILLALVLVFVVAPAAGFASCCAIGGLFGGERPSNSPRDTVYSSQAERTRARGNATHGKVSDKPLAELPASCLDPGNGRFEPKEDHRYASTLAGDYKVELLGVGLGHPHKWVLFGTGRRSHKEAILCALRFTLTAPNKIAHSPEKDVQIRVRDSFANLLHVVMVDDKAHGATRAPDPARTGEHWINVRAYELPFEGADHIAITVAEGWVFPRDVCTWRVRMADVVRF